MSSRSMGSGKQVVSPPQRGIFPLDHGAACRKPMETYIACLQNNADQHNKCREYSREYLQCRMDNDLMTKENLDNLGYSEDKKVEGAREYDYSKEQAGFVAGTHISKESKWWWQR